jgi:hypothetical protein
VETKGIFPFYLILNQKCEYENVDLPCTDCHARGLTCGAEQKVGGPKAIIPGCHILTLSLNGSSDFVGPGEDYLRSFRTRFCEQNGIIIDLGRNQEYANSMGVLYIVYPFPKFSFSSDCFRYSLLAMESSRCAHGERNLVTTKYYQQALADLRMAIDKSAIDKSAVMEVLVASYAMLVYTCFSEYELFRNVALFYNGVSAAFAKLIEQRSREQNIILASNLWIASLQLLEISYWGIVRQSILGPSGPADKTHGVIQYSFTCKCLMGIQEWRPLRNEMCATEPLRTNLMFCFDYYLANKNASIMQQ